MFQNIKQILILDKDNSSYSVMISFIKGKKSIQTHVALCEKK